MQKVSIIVMTHNRVVVLEKTLRAMLHLDYPAGHEIIVVNDGSTDNTKNMLKKFSGKIRVINEERSGPCRARNNGIKKARFPIIVIMDDDCIPDRNWLKNLVGGFTSSDIGVVSSFSIYGGTSTAFRKDILDKVGLYDEEYFYYREDTDLVFRVMDAGYKARLVKAKYVHEHKMEAPKSIMSFVRHAFERVKYHKNDVLLYKKNPKRAKDFLDIKFGFIINPLKDMNTVTYRWTGERPADLKPGETVRLSSPRGITYIEEKTLLHFLAIIICAFLYVLVVKTVRLYATFRFKKPLI